MGVSSGLSDKGQIQSIPISNWTKEVSIRGLAYIKQNFFHQDKYQYFMQFTVFLY